jgi:hypothetical protein
MFNRVSISFIVTLYKALFQSHCCDCVKSVKAGDKVWCYGLGTGVLHYFAFENLGGQALPCFWHSAVIVDLEYMACMCIKL